jgi:maltooligosyltrehalose trehalohydrolase
VRRGRRAEFAAFGWDPGRIPDPQDERTFAASRLRWEERSVAPHARVLGWYRDVLALRARTPALHDGRRDRVAVTSHREGGLVLRRPPITIAANLGAGGIRLPLSGRLLLASHPSVTLRGNRISLPPNAVAFVEDRG